MSSNENALGPSPKAMEAIQKALPRLQEYGYRTDEALRIALAKKFDMGIDADQFVTANGGLELIDMIARGFLEPGLECIFSDPTFHVYEIFTHSNGAKAVNVPLIGDNWELDVEGILNAVNDNTRLLFITNPNNPTGTRIPKDKVDELIYNLPDHVVVIHDEVYWHFADLENFPKAEKYIRDGKKVIGLHSFSKAYGLAGLRVGFAYSTPEVTNYLHKLSRPFIINTLSMEGALAALEDEEHLQNTQKMIDEGKKYLYPELDRLKIHYWKSHTNFILFKSPMKMTPTDLVNKMLSHGVMIREGANNGALGCIRVTLGKPAANRAFIAALEKVID